MSPPSGAVAGGGGDAMIGKSLQEQTADIGKPSETAGRKARELKCICAKLAQLLIIRANCRKQQDAKLRG